jgi:hypothetical protein
MVELWSNVGFAKLIDKRIRRGSFASVAYLMAITYDYLDDY